MRLRSLALLVACACLTERGAAQESPVEFRRGQWGALFSIENPFAGIGALRFTSPSAAWTLNASVALSGQTTTAPTLAGTVTQRGHGINAVVDVGRRRYRPARGRVVAFYGLGLTGGYQGNRSRVDTSSAAQDSWRAGVFADIGAQVHVTPYLSLGAVWPIRAQHWWSSNNSGYRSTSWTLSATTLRLQGGLYF